MKKDFPKFGGGATLILDIEVPTTDTNLERIRQA